MGALSYPYNELTIIEDTAINSQSVITILEKLKFKHSTNTVINCVLDNARYQKSFIIQDYIKNNPNIKLHYLPAYSPNLNLIERLWKFMHKHVTNNWFYQYFEDFRYSFLSFLRLKFLFFVKLCLLCILLLLVKNIIQIFLSKILIHNV